MTAFQGGKITIMYNNTSNSSKNYKEKIDHYLNIDRSNKSNSVATIKESAAHIKRLL